MEEVVYLGRGGDARVGGRGLELGLRLGLGHGRGVGMSHGRSLAACRNSLVRVAPPGAFKIRLAEKVAKRGNINPSSPAHQEILSNSNTKWDNAAALLQEQKVHKWQQSEAKKSLRNKLMSSRNH